MCFSVTIVDETKKSGICKDHCECHKILEKMKNGENVFEDICKDHCECHKFWIENTTIAEGNPGTINYEKLFCFFF